MSPRLDRRLRALEENHQRGMSADEITFIPDADLDWLVSLPAREDRSGYDFSRWTAADFERAEAIRLAAIAAARIAKTG